MASQDKDDIAYKLTVLPSLIISGKVNCFILLTSSMMGDNWRTFGLFLYEYSTMFVSQISFNASPLYSPLTFFKDRRETVLNVPAALTFWLNQKAEPLLPQERGKLV